MPELLFVIGMGGVVLLGTVIFISRCYRSVDQGYALVVGRVRTVDVTFTGTFVIPTFNRAEVLDITTKDIVVSIDGDDTDGLVTKDDVKVSIHAIFTIRVNKTKEDVLRVARSVGCDRASHQETLDKLFLPKFSTAIKIVGRQLEFDELFKQRARFTDEVINEIGRDLNGFVLEDVAIDRIERA